MPSIRSSIFLCFFISCIWLSSCNTGNNNENLALKSKFNTADSLIIEDNWDKAYPILMQIRANADANDPVLSSYYVAMAEHNRYVDAAKMTAYADSALKFFDDKESREIFRTEFLNALLMRGDACMISKQYNSALEYYYRGKKLLTEGGCDDGNLATKIAGIYFRQKNYRLAARGLVESYRLFGVCDTKMSAQKLFYARQGALNNAAYAYQRAGMEDSALYYYQKDIALLDKTEADGKVDQPHLLGARIVVNDNLAGICINRKNYTKALAYLTKCVEANVPTVDGIKIPPYIKLGQIYTITGEYTKAADAFERSKQLIQRFHAANVDSEISWNKLYAQYLLKLKQPDKAFKYLNTYLRLNDEMERSQANIYKVDVERAQNMFHQQQALTDLRHQDKLSQIYILCISIAVLLLIVIMVLVYRSLNASRKNHRLTENQNLQLQQTLTQLEAANKNYIRIMRVMAHDLRNPLSGISGLAALLLEEEEGELSADNRHVLELIESTGTNAIDMINELLKSGLANEDEDLIKKPLDVNSLLEDSVKLLQFKANDKQQKIVFDPNAAPVMISASHEKIWRVFNNLIVNAIKFSYPGGTIEVDIEITADKKYVQVSVADNGVGIPDKDKSSIYDMFTTAKKVGTSGEEPFGLGLSITKKIVEQHDGKLWFTSGDGETVFYVELPYLKNG